VFTLSSPPSPAVPVGTYTNWSWPPTPAGYRQMASDLEPHTDPSPAGYFWCHQMALIGGKGAYFGLQTLGTDPTGKIPIFSVWGALEAEGPEYVVPFDGEGEGFSVRMKYEWTPGRREHLSIRSDGQGWWRAEVGGRLVGRIRVDPTWRAWTRLQACGPRGTAARWAPASTWGTLWPGSVRPSPTGP
jgi:hypothetical protein